MDPARKRMIRLVVALGAAVILASALIYTSFHGSDETVVPTQLARMAQPGRSYQLTGTVVHDSVHRDGRGAATSAWLTGRAEVKQFRSPTRGPSRTPSTKDARSS